MVNDGKPLLSTSHPRAPWYKRLWGWWLGPVLSKSSLVNEEREWFFRSPDALRTVEFSDLQDPNSFGVKVPPTDSCDKS